MTPNDPGTPPSAAGDSMPPLSNDGQEPRVLLAAVDTSSIAERVVALAARFARSLPAAELHIMHVLRVSRIDRAQHATPVAPAEAVEESKDHLAFHVRRAKAMCRNNVTSHFFIGDPTAEILKACQELKADLLFIATHDQSGFERLLLGSIAETLMRKAPCSLVTVRKPPET